MRYRAVIARRNALPPARVARSHFGLTATPTRSDHPFPSKTSKIESLDYDIVEDAVYRADQAKRIPLKKLRYAMMKWALSLIVGVGTALIAFLINLSVENIAGIKFEWTFAAMSHTYFGAFLVYALLNCLLVFGSACIVTYYAPAAAGSGIPEVKSYLNGVDLPGVLLFRTLIGKVSHALAPFPPLPSSLPFFPAFFGLPGITFEQRSIQMMFVKNQAAAFFSRRSRRAHSIRSTRASCVRARRFLPNLNSQGCSGSSS